MTNPIDPGPYYVGPLLAITGVSWSVAPTTLPVNTPQYLPGYLDKSTVANTPHGMPNCNAGDPQDPENADELRADVGYGYTGLNYIVGWRDFSEGHVVCDLARSWTDVAGWGGRISFGATCIGYGPWIAKHQIPDGGQDRGTYRLAFTTAAAGTWDWQFVMQSTFSPPEPASLFLVGSIASTGEDPQSLTWSVPVGEVATFGVTIGYLRCGTIHSPEMWISDGTGAAVSLVIEEDASHRYAYAIRSGAGPYTAGTVTTYTINAFGWGTSHLPGQPKVPETATLTINWIA